MRDAARLPKSEAKSLFGRGGKLHAMASETYRDLFGERSPIEVLMRGALVPCEYEMTLSTGERTRWANIAPLIDASANEDVHRAYVLNDQLYTCG